MMATGLAPLASYVTSYLKVRKRGKEEGAEKDAPDFVIVSLELEVHGLAELIAAVSHHEVLRQLGGARHSLSHVLFLHV